MKLRQKLAVVLATAMVATSLPVVTMAASNNRLKIETPTVKKDSILTTASTLNIEFKDHMKGDTEVFYLKLTNCEFNKDEMKKLYANKVEDGHEVFTLDNCYAAEGVTYTWQTDKEIKVDATNAKNIDGDYVALPLGGIKVTGSDASIEIISNRSTTTVSGQKYTLANTSDKVFKYSVGDKTTFYTDSNSKLAELTLDEAYIGSLFSDDDKKTIITLELDDTDFNFYGYESVSDKNDVFANANLQKSSGDDQQVEYKFGYNSSIVKTYAAVDAKDKGKLYIGIEYVGANKPDSTGQIILKSLRVDCLVKDPDTGEFLVDIKGDDLADGKDDVVMGEVSAFAVSLKMDGDKAKEIVGGRQEEIKFELAEVVENSMVTGREMEIKLVDNAHFDYKWLVKEYYGDADKALAAYNKDFDKDAKSLGDDEYKTLAAALPKAWLTDKIVDNKGDWTVADKDAKDNTLVKGKQLYLEFDKDDDGKAITDTLIVFVGRDNDGHETQSNDKKDKITFKLKACVPLDKKDKEKVELKASGRAIDSKEVTTTAITIKNPVTITTEPVTLKVGLQDQVGGKIVITETEKEMFQQDGTITISVKDKAAGIKFQEDCEFEASSGIKKVKVSTNKEGTQITFTIKRDSKEAATITIPELHFTTDRTVPEGTYDIEIGGTALDKDGHTITVEDFIVIGTKNTGDIENAANGLASGTAKFVIGESKYTLNDKEVQMDAAAYIQDPGYTMVPVAYVAEAFGVSRNNITANKGVVTIFAGNRTIQLTNGSEIAIVNGVSVPMNTKVVIKDGRTYAPIGEIANILGIKKDWDPNTKTAVFTN